MSLRATIAGKLKYHLAAAPAMRHDALSFAVGSVEARLIRQTTIDRIEDAEFRVFSQFGHDGIIQFLVAHVPIEHDIFVEFGVESYSESNTRFLLMHDNWRGLILSPGTAHLEYLEASNLMWRHSIDAKTAFVTRGNINELLDGAGISGDIGLLSIDIDGNDYWVLEAIDAISPRIIVVEYNGIFGVTRKVSIPYQADFDRMDAHSSGLYFGASLPAMVSLAERKGYRFLGTTSAGGDAFFVRNDVADGLPPLEPPALTEPKFRQSRDEAGGLTYQGGLPEQRALLRGLEVVDVDTFERIEVTDLT